MQLGIVLTDGGQRRQFGLTKVGEWSLLELLVQRLRFLPAGHRLERLLSLLFRQLRGSGLGVLDLLLPLLLVDFEQSLVQVLAPYLAVGSSLTVIG